MTISNTEKALAKELKKTASVAAKTERALTKKITVLERQLRERDAYDDASAFSILMRLCGLSQKDAAEFLGVDINTIKAWSSRQRRTRPGARARLRGLYQALEERGKNLAADINIAAKVASESGGRFHGVLVLSENDEMAREMGYACVSAHATALGIALCNLDDGVKAYIETRPPSEDRPQDAARFYELHEYGTDDGERAREALQRMVVKFGKEKLAECGAGLKLDDDGMIVWPWLDETRPIDEIPF